MARKPGLPLRTGYIVRYHADAIHSNGMVGGWLSSGGASPHIAHAHEFPTSAAAERAAMLWGTSCYTIRTYSRRYFASLFAREEPLQHLRFVWYTGSEVASYATLAEGLAAFGCKPPDGRAVYQRDADGTLQFIRNLPHED